jgi:hypothetical protein
MMPLSVYLLVHQIDKSLGSATLLPWSIRLTPTQSRVIALLADAYYVRHLGHGLATKVQVKPAHNFYKPHGYAQCDYPFFYS